MKKQDVVNFKLGPGLGAGTEVLGIVPGRAGHILQSALMLSFGCLLGSL